MASSVLYIYLWALVGSPWCRIQCQSRLAASSWSCCMTWLRFEANCCLVRSYLPCQGSNPNMSQLASQPISRPQGRQTPPSRRQPIQEGNLYPHQALSIASLHESHTFWAFFSLCLQRQSCPLVPWDTLYLQGIIRSCSRIDPDRYVWQVFWVMSADLTPELAQLLVLRSRACWHRLCILQLKTWAIDKIMGTSRGFREMPSYVPSCWGSNIALHLQWLLSLQSNPWYRSIKLSMLKPAFMTAAEAANSPNLHFSMIILDRWQKDDSWEGVRRYDQIVPKILTNNVPSCTRCYTRSKWVTLLMTTIGEASRGAVCEQLDAPDCITEEQITSPMNVKYSPQESSWLIYLTLSNQLLWQSNAPTDLSRLSPIRSVAAAAAICSKMQRGWWTFSRCIHDSNRNAHEPTGSSLQDFDFSCAPVQDCNISALNMSSLAGQA